MLTKRWTNIFLIWIFLLMVFVCLIKNIKHLLYFTLLIILTCSNLTDILLRNLILIFLLYNYILKNVFDIIIYSRISINFWLGSTLWFNRFISNYSFLWLIWILQIFIFYLSLYFIVLQFSFFIIIQIQNLNNFFIHSKSR